MIFTTLQRYILREILRVAILAIIALTGIIFVGMAVELVRKGLSVLQLRDMIPFVVAHSLPYAMPAAFLVAVVLVFGRLSGNNEISAVRAGGVNLNHLVYPLIILGLLISMGTFGLNHFLLPWTFTHMRAVKDTLIKRAIEHAGATHTRFELGEYLIYVGGAAEDKRYKWKNVALIKFVDEYPALIVLADEGGWLPSTEPSVIPLALRNCSVFRPMLSEATGDATLFFEEMEYPIRLNEENKVPEIEYNEAERALINDSVQRALKHTGGTGDSMTVGNQLIFYNRTGQEGSWLQTSVVTFSDAEIPAQVSLAESGRYVVNDLGDEASLELRNVRVWNAVDGRLKPSAQGAEQERALRLDLLAARRVPDVGTNPLAHWLHTRPKYLYLPDLLAARKVRRAKAEQIRSLPQYAEVRHPENRRRSAERKAETIYRDYYLLAKKIPSLQQTVNQADIALTQAGEELRLAGLRLADAVEKEKRLSEVAQDRGELLKQLEMDLERLKGRTNADDTAARERVEQHLEKIAKHKEGLAEAEAQLGNAREALRAAREKRDAAGAALEQKTQAQQAAEAALLDQKRQTFKIKREWNHLRQIVNDMKIVERYLETETHYHFRNAGAVTTLIFMLVGIPLGILCRRGNVMMAFAVSFCTVLLVYYPLQFLGQMFGESGFMAPWLSQWLPNMALGGGGLGLLTWGIRR